MEMNRRTILKGILGAAASAFCPVLAKDLAPDLDLRIPENFVECLKSGSYFLQLNCILEKVAGNETHGHHEILIRSGERSVHGISGVLQVGNQVALHMSGMMTVSLKKGDRLSAEYRLNGVVQKHPVEIELAVVPCDELGALDSFMCFTTIESIPTSKGKELRVTVD